MLEHFGSKMGFSWPSLAMGASTAISSPTPMRGFLGLVMFAFLCVGVSACGGDDDFEEELNEAMAEIDATAGVKINGANVIKADIMATNGVIHVIDAVILP